MAVLAAPKHAQLKAGMWLKVPVGDDGRGVVFVARVWKPARRVGTALGYFFARSFAATVDECRSAHSLSDADRVTVFYGMDSDFKRWGIIGTEENPIADEVADPLFYDALRREVVVLADDVYQSKIPRGPVPTGRTASEFPRTGQESAIFVAAMLEKIDREFRAQ
ncbi:hypothetical protein GOEFS_039_00260 [Gordonia effusa NBRC 100432]|uniref:Uncharacterized protein n=1 Tax=Gordonia effusa NBRC 100432 TaxID=1077974 RepID=H0QY91_9ACTN|nr:hypothetical protein [Gordonia effusa]GAB17792.1 hypothetical protein GOEFS_039_00260 [Gordonia effusa NBRC 100432]